MALMGAHGRGQGKMLGCRSVIASAGEGEPEAELGIVVARAGLDDQGEIAGRGGVLAGVELRARQRLKYAPGSRLGCGGPLQQLSGRRRTAPAEQVQATFVELMGVSAVSGNRIGSIL